MPKKLWVQTNQILTNDDEVCIPRLSSILLAVITTYFESETQKLILILKMKFCCK